MVFPRSQQTSYFSINLDRVTSKDEGCSPGGEGLQTWCCYDSTRYLLPIHGGVPARELQLGIPFLTLLSAFRALTSSSANVATQLPHI